MACCGGSRRCTCTIVAGPGTSVDGGGSTTDPYIISGATCEQMRQCLSAGPGVSYDPATGVIGADAVVTGCGLAGSGTAEDPLAASTATWPFACDISNATGLYCDPDSGQLVAGPPTHTAMQSYYFDQNYSNVPVPAARDQVQARIEAQFTNPDPCRPAFMLVERELEFGLTFPPGSSAEYGFDGPDQMVRHFNTGSTTEVGWHMQVTKVLSGGVAQPGETRTVGFDALAGLGTGGATYTHIQGILRVLFISSYS